MEHLSISTPHDFDLIMVDMSPELMNFEPPSFKSDIWALGVILYEIAALDLPFRGSNLASIMESVIRKPYDALPTHYSKELASLTQVLLCKKESLR